MTGWLHTAKGLWTYSCSVSVGEGEQGYCTRGLNWSKPGRTIEALRQGRLGLDQFSVNWSKLVEVQDQSKLV